ncbi:delta(14)-sterol reductase isoform X3 [Primulina eburnea]|uniref:delta(14)-sterol reductase isoform X3 n=1 Tax=Primulina eburnea TaxID=1245227 RepID=UPI003C6C56F2
MDLSALLLSLIPSWTSVAMILLFFTYLAIVGSLLPGKVVPGAVLSDGTRLHYRCNGLLSLIVLVFLLGIGGWMDFISLTAIADRGLELLSTTFVFSVFMTFLLYITGYNSRSQSSSLKPRVTGNFIHDWWFGIQLNPQFMGIDLKWDIIAERLGFMLVFGDLVWIPFTFSIQGWWLKDNEVELTTAAVVANCLVFLIGYLVFRGANKQKHDFKKNPKAHIWGRPPKIIGGKLLASGYWAIARHSNYLGDLLVALSFSLPCGISSIFLSNIPICFTDMERKERRSPVCTEVQGSLGGISVPGSLEDISICLLMASSCFMYSSMDKFPFPYLS